MAGFEGSEYSSFNEAAARERRIRKVPDTLVPPASCFNEAAARERRIQRSRNASCAKGFHACLREPRPIIAQLSPFASNRERKPIHHLIFKEHFLRRAVPGVFGAT